MKIDDESYLENIFGIVIGADRHGLPLRIFFEKVTFYQTSLPVLGRRESIGPTVKKCVKKQKRKKDEIVEDLNLGKLV